MNLKNHEFINSKGVFQGGGCKAVAFIGAYESALENGVCFTEFAGTSAGSIFAAIIAAGASVEEMKNFIDSLDVDYLISKAQKKRGFFGRIGLHFLKLSGKYFMHLKPSMVTAIVSTLLDNGMCDAKVLENIIEKELQHILNIDTQVRFSDLKFPLTIIASDIKGHTVKVWNKKDNPNESVAKAVSCSCAIPGYFKPVDGRYLDGGLLSNLPVSFFEENSEEFSNILAFTLSYEEQNSKQNNVKNYLADIMSTITEGATSLQLRTHHNIFVVPVKTKMGLLDFDLLNIDSKPFKSSIQEGKKSFLTFLNNYHQNIEPKETPMHSNQYLLKVASCSCEKQDEIVCLIDNYKKVYKLFLTILKWRNNSKEISVYIQNKGPYGNVELDYVVRLLSHMGINVFVVNDSLPVLGYFFKKSNRWKSILVGKFGADYKAQYYNSELESKFANAFIHSLKELQYASCYNELSQILLRKIDSVGMIQKLKTVVQYQDCIISFKRIRIDTLYFMHDFVYGYKYRAMDELVRLYGKANLEVFSPAEFILAEGKSSIITPPIVECHGNDLVVISGLTRLFYAYKQNIKDVIIAVVENCEYSTPTDGRFKVQELRIKDTPLDIEEKSKRKYQNYRFIEQALRPTNLSLL